jgi:hypothetical protein
MKKIIIILLILLFIRCEEKPECLSCKDIYYFVLPPFPVQTFIYDTTYIKCPEEGQELIPYMISDRLPISYVQQEVDALKDWTFHPLGYFIRTIKCEY